MSTENTIMLLLLGSLAVIAILKDIKGIK